MRLISNIRKGSLNSTKWGSKMHHLSFRPLVVLNNEVNFKRNLNQTQFGLGFFLFGTGARGFSPTFVLRSNANGVRKSGGSHRGARSPGTRPDSFCRAKYINQPAVMQSNAAYKSVSGYNTNP